MPGRPKPPPEDTETAAFRYIKEKLTGLLLTLNFLNKIS
jgi:hypothetical protein